MSFTSLCDSWRYCSACWYSFTDDIMDRWYYG